VGRPVTKEQIERAESSKVQIFEHIEKDLECSCGGLLLRFVHFDNRAPTDQPLRPQPPSERRSRCLKWASGAPCGGSKPRS